MDCCQCHTCGLTIPAQTCTFCNVRVMLWMLEQIKIDRSIDYRSRHERASSVSSQSLHNFNTTVAVAQQLSVIGECRPNCRIARMASNRFFWRESNRIKIIFGESECTTLHYTVPPAALQTCLLVYSTLNVTFTNLCTFLSFIARIFLIFHFTNQL